MAIPTKHVFVCINSRPQGHPRGCCQVKGGGAIRELLKKRIAESELRGRVRVTATQCLGQCEHGVSVVVYPEGVWYGFVRAEDVEEIFESHLLGNRPVERLRQPAECLGAAACPHRQATADTGRSAEISTLAEPGPARYTGLPPEEGCRQEKL